MVVRPNGSRMDHGLWSVYRVKVIQLSTARAGNLAVSRTSKFWNKSPFPQALQNQRVRKLDKSNRQLPCASYHRGQMFVKVFVRTSSAHQQFRRDFVCKGKIAFTTLASASHHERTFVHACTFHNSAELL